jgi:hypothetical protein
VTTPEEETVATEVLFEDQVTDLSIASAGDTVAVNVRVSPKDSVISVLFKLTPVTLGFTVTTQLAVLDPSDVVTVIVAFPADCAMTTPEEDTDATEVLLDDHVTDLSVAFDGETVAVKAYVSPSARVNEDLSKFTFVT